MFREVFTITEKDTIRTYSRLKTPTTCLDLLCDCENFAKVLCELYHLLASDRPPVLMKFISYLVSVLLCTNCTSLAAPYNNITLYNLTNIITTNIVPGSGYIYCLIIVDGFLLSDSNTARHQSCPAGINT